MNANMFHNILNLVGLVVGSLVTFDWAGIGMSAPVAASVAGGFILADKIIKLGMNITRDGIGGLFTVQPPVEK